ncbi:hypothetical protein BJ508DRAFT_367806 [Ascobolus immersus RN42]|uniref:Uncharacterized protein n=1 Tax=Ascobolus immersus RN42 TaxID=1160509 RepID=A0A3N4H9J2_ASCIM|nr:hypothetical protein BJ508DRAFT_367806 [Ascobolus immersus RN42]
MASSDHGLTAESQSGHKRGHSSDSNESASLPPIPVSVQEVLALEIEQNLNQKPEKKKTKTGRKIEDEAAKSDESMESISSFDSNDSNVITYYDKSALGDVEPWASDIGVEPAAGSESDFGPDSACGSDLDPGESSGETSAEEDEEDSESDSESGSQEGHDDEDSKASEGPDDSEVGSERTTVDSKQSIANVGHTTIQSAPVLEEGSASKETKEEAQQKDPQSGFKKFLPFDPEIYDEWFESTSPECENLKWGENPCREKGRRFDQRHWSKVRLHGGAIRTSRPTL